MVKRVPKREVGEGRRKWGRERLVKTVTKGEVGEGKWKIKSGR